MAEAISGSFRGNNVTRVDDKHRLKLASDFKALVEDGTEFFITSLDGQRAFLYPIKEWELREAALGQLAPSHPARVKFQQLTAYFGAQVTLDSQGRLQLPSPLREEAKLTGEVVVLGMAGKLKPGFLEVMNHELFKAQAKQNPWTQMDAMELAAVGL